MRRRALPVLLLAGAAACAVIGLTRQSGAALSSPGPLPPPPATPVLSVRRVPGVLAGLVADQKLAARLTGVLGDPGALTESCLQVRVAGVPVFGRNASRPLLPASNVKLLTAFAAVARLGADSVFTTSIVAAKPASNGVVQGPLILVGGGDPLLATADYRPSQTEWTLSSEPVTKLEDLADRVKAAGVTRVTGGVQGDDTRFDSQRTVPTWKPSYLTSGEVGPVGALEVNGGFTISGRRQTPDTNPALTAAGIFSGLLQARGIAVEGAAGLGSAPASAASIASIDSLSVRDVVGIMLRESDNLAAEMLVKELGHRFGGAGSWAAGLGVLRDTLSGAKVPQDGLALVDGSGLDRSDRASCATLAGLDTAPVGAVAAVIAGLPRAGNCGTLAKRFLGQPAAGRIRAKTGSLLGVAALTGFVDPAPLIPPPSCPPTPAPPARPATTGAPTAAASPGAASSGATSPGAAGQPVTFSLLVNGLGTDAAGRSVEDRVADALVTYPELPPIEEFGP